MRVNGGHSVIDVQHVIDIGGPPPNSGEVNLIAGLHPQFVRVAMMKLLVPLPSMK